MKSIFTSFPKFFPAVGLLLAAAGLAAQPCSIEQPNAGGITRLANNIEIGQTFTACGNGVITEIQASVRDSVGKTLTFELFNADDRLTPLDSQLVLIGAGGDVSVLLNEPFAVVDGQEYAFSFSGITEDDVTAYLEGTFGNPYPGGNVYQVLSGEVAVIPDSDLEFAISIVPNACTQFQGAAFTSFFLQPQGIGQVFKSCAVGALTEVSVDFKSVGDDTLYFDIVSVDSIDGKPLYRQLILNPKVGQMTIELETPFLVDTLQYGFLLKTTENTNETTRVHLSAANPYEGGTAIEIFDDTVLLPPNYDMKFGVTIVEPVNLIDQPDVNGFANISSAITVGQSFTADKNGRVSHIRFSNINGNLTEIRLDLNLGTDTNGADYSQVSQISGSGDHLIALHQGFNVLEGETYAFSVTGVGDALDNINAINDDPYPEGRLFTINGGAVTPFSSDLDFSILTFEDEGIVSVPNIGDLSTRLNNAYPNPASGEFMVSYTLDESCEVIVELYDMNGRQLRQIQQGRQPEGAYLETISIASLPAGMYMYGIRTETGHSVMKRIVVN